MREVQLVWDAHPEQTTVFGGLTSVLESMEVLSHLEIAEDGVRQIIAPEFLPERDNDYTGRHRCFCCYGRR